MSDLLRILRLQGLKYSLGINSGESTSKEEASNDEDDKITKEEMLRVRQQV